MHHHLINKLLTFIHKAPGMYYRLILIVGPSGSGKTELLRLVANHIQAPLINLNLRLSQHLLELTHTQRCLSVERIIEEIFSEAKSHLILLDNTELVFHPDLKIDPLKLFQSLSRNRTLIVSWNGRIQNGQLEYAVPEHPEYRKYPIQDFLYVQLSK